MKYAVSDLGGGGKSCPHIEEMIVQFEELYHQFISHPQT